MGSIPIYLPVKYAFYTTSEEAWAAMYEAIKNARVSVYLETYIFRNTVPGFDFLEILREKAREGVKVKMVIDGLSVFFSGREAKRKLEPVGGEVLLFRHWFHRIHRKVLIIDEQIVFIGGVNFGKRFVGWFDTHVRIDGRVAKSAINSFAYSYALSGGRDPQLLARAGHSRVQRTRRKIAAVKHRLLEHWPFKGQSALKEFYLEKIGNAKSQITIITTYFLPHKWFIAAIQGAVRRGVNVHVIMPHHSDFWMLDIARLTFAKELSKDGIRFFLSEEMIHAKVLLVDNEEGMIGSNNIDALSFDFNLEASLHFNRKDMVGDLRRIIERWRKESKPFESFSFSSSWYQKPVEWLARLFQPIL